MAEITRRDSLILGTGALAAAALPGRARAAIPVGSATPPSYPAENGATLRVLRPTKFVDPDETIFRENTKAFTDATGVPVRVDFVSWEDLRPQTAVSANTGAGPDIIIGWGDDPHLYAEKIMDLTDLADYLGAKYGGWYQLAEIYGRQWGTKTWIAIPLGGSSGPAVYRMSWLKEAGFDKFPGDLDGFLKLCQALQKTGHPSGFALGHAVGDANAFCNWMLWAHGGSLADEKGQVAIDSKATVDALNYCKELYPVMIPGTLSWNDASNNKAFEAGQIALTQNGVSIYYSIKNSKNPDVAKMADDINHQFMPFGKAGGPPETSLVVNAMVFKHTKYPNAARDYLRFMMEEPQYDKWLTGCLGYWSQPLKAYAQSAIWSSDPKLLPYREGMNTPFYWGYRGPITDASSAVSANYTVVDMFASVASGAATPEAAAAAAAKQAARYYGKS